MPKHKKIVRGALAVLLAGGTALALAWGPMARAAADADGVTLEQLAQAPPAGGPADRPDGPHRMPSPMRHIEGRLAYLKAELKITPAQEPAWNKVAAAMRDAAQKAEQGMQQAFADRKNASALQLLETRAKLADLRAAETHSLLDAAKPLYDSFSDEQKKTATELLSPHHGWGMRP